MLIFKDHFKIGLGPINVPIINQLILILRADPNNFILNSDCNGISLNNITLVKHTI